MSPVTPEERLAYRPAEAADLLGVSRAMVYQLMKAGALRYVIIGTSRRIPRWALEEFLQPSESELRAAWGDR